MLWCVCCGSQRVNTLLVGEFSAPLSESCCIILSLSLVLTVFSLFLSPHSSWCGSLLHSLSFTLTHTHTRIDTQTHTHNHCKVLMVANCISLFHILSDEHNLLCSCLSGCIFKTPLGKTGVAWTSWEKLRCKTNFSLNFSPLFFYRGGPLLADITRPGRFRHDPETRCYI